MIMTNKNWPKTILVVLTCVIIILQTTGASFAQTKMSLTALDGADTNTVIICTSEGFKTVHLSGPGTPLKPQNIDCKCPACAHLGTDKLSGVITGTAHVTRQAIVIDAEFELYQVSSNQRSARKPIKARSPPIPS